MFITIEGPDRVGKSTLSKGLRVYIGDKFRIYHPNGPWEVHDYFLHHRDFIPVREPGTTKEAEAIRSLLLNNDIDLNFDNTTEFLLFMACRNELNKKILKNSNSRIIMSDRYDLSTFVYQCVVGKLSIDFFRYMSTMMFFKIPEITILLCPMGNDSNFIKRLSPDKNKFDNNTTEDKFENRGLQYQLDILEGYRNIVKYNVEGFIDETELNTFNHHKFKFQDNRKFIFVDTTNKSEEEIYQETLYKLDTYFQEVLGCDIDTFIKNKNYVQD